MSFWVISVLILSDVPGGSPVHCIKSPADRLDDRRLRLLVLDLPIGQHPEDPAGEDLLDRPVERERREARRDLALEGARFLRFAHDVADERVRLGDLVRVAHAERVRRAHDLDDDDLHQRGVVAVEVDDRRGDRVQLVARRDRRAIGLADEVEQDLPALEEQRVEHLVLRAEVVVDEAVGDVRLVGDVRHAALVKAALGERDDRGVEDEAALVRTGERRVLGGGRAHAGVSTGQRYAAGRRLASAGRSRRMRAWASRSRSATIAPSRSEASACTIPHGSTIIERPPERSAPPAALAGACSPIWLAATTNAWFSIARARTSTSQ